MATRTIVQRGQKRRAPSPSIVDTQNETLAQDSVLPQTVDGDVHRFGTALRTIDIQGFRSFGPLAADTGHIDWMSPVTLILGPNGTGKTVSAKRSLDWLIGR